MSKKQTKKQQPKTVEQVRAEIADAYEQMERDAAKHPERWVECWW